MKFEAAKEWLEARSSAVVGLKPDEGPGAVRTQLDPETLHRAMLHGLLEADEVIQPLLMLGGAATITASCVQDNITRAQRAAHELEGDERQQAIECEVNSAIATVHGAMVQAFALGLKMGEGRS